MRVFTVRSGVVHYGDDFCPFCDFEFDKCRIDSEHKVERCPAQVLDEEGFECAHVVPDNCPLRTDQTVIKLDPVEKLWCGCRKTPYVCTTKAETYCKECWERKQSCG